MDIWDLDKCIEKLENSKCHKRKVRNNCAFTCGYCTDTTWWKPRGTTTSPVPEDSNAGIKEQQKSMYRLKKNSPTYRVIYEGINHSD